MKAIWKGSVSFGLVNIPVKIYSAIESVKVNLDMLDRKTGDRIRYKRVAESSGKEVPWEQIVKGYRKDNKYVILEDEDFEKASPVKSKVFEIESFLNIQEVDPVYFDTTYLMEPEKNGLKAYSLLLKVLAKSGKAGLGKFVLRTKEHLSVIRPWRNALVIQRLHFADEVRLPGTLNLDVKPVEQKEIKIAMDIIKQYTEKFDISKYKDDYKKEIMKLIRSKEKGKTVPAKKMRVVHTRKDELYDKLKASLKAKKAS